MWPLPVALVTRGGAGRHPGRGSKPFARRDFRERPARHRRRSTVEFRHRAEASGGDVGQDRAEVAVRDHAQQAFVPVHDRKLGLWGLADGVHDLVDRRFFADRKGARVVGVRHHETLEHSHVASVPDPLSPPAEPLGVE